MAIVQLSRYKTDNQDEMIKAAKQGKVIFEKNDAEYLRLSRVHAGEFAGLWLVTSRFANWEVYGKAQEAIAKDKDFTKLLAHIATFATLMGRNIAVGVDL